MPVEDWESLSVVEDSDQDLIYIYNGKPLKERPWSRAVGSCWIRFEAPLDSRRYRQGTGVFSETLGSNKKKSAQAASDGSPELDPEKTHTYIYRIDAELLNRFGLNSRDGGSSTYPRFDHTALIKAAANFKGFDN